MEINTLSDNQWIEEEIKEKLENTYRWLRMKPANQTLWDAVKAVLRKKFIAIND